MFKQNMATKDAAQPGGDTVIASGVRVEGDFQSQGNLIIEGEVMGSVKTSADLFVGEKARIHASVVAANAKVSGEVRGNIKVKERLELGPVSRIAGDIKTKTLIVEAGATINGKIAMGEDEGTASKAVETAFEKGTDGLSVLLGTKMREKTKV